MFLIPMLIVMHAEPRWKVTNMNDIKKQNCHYSSRYALIKDEKRIEFNSEKEACEFLGVRQSSVSSCFRSGCKCKGYKVEKIGLSTHGETKTRLHKIWASMHERCERETHEYYADYGGRGIIVCNEWEDFIIFRDWALNNGYKDNLTIDRKDVNGDYEPSNCRWVTMKEQQNNKRNNRCLTWNDDTKTISEWVEIVGINKTTIKERLNSGWSVEKALSTPVRRRTKGYRPSSSV